MNKHISNTIALLTSLLLACSSTIVNNNYYVQAQTLSENSIDNKVITEDKINKDKQLNNESETHKNDNSTKTVNIKMVGDCLIHSALYKQAKDENGEYNFDFMFEHIKSDIEEADIAIINQETIFTADRNDYSSYPMFGSPVEVGDAEVNAGFDVIACATNHTMDKGIQGIEDTINFWKTKHPSTTILGIHDNKDDSDIRYITKNDVKIAFINYTYGLNGLESRRVGKEYLVDLLCDEDVTDNIKEAKNNSDFVIAIVHAGTEYVYEPTDYQIQQVEKCIDAGADLVFCAHPHVIEPYEVVKTEKGNTALVYWSLGNFISSQDEMPRVLGGMADVTISKTINNNSNTVQITDYTMIPLVTHQEKGGYTTYKLEDYTDELASRHRLGIHKQDLYDLWNKIIK